MSTADFYSPSKNFLAGKKLPMELVIKGVSIHQTEIEFSIFFEEGPLPYIELFSLGFGRNIIRKLPSCSDLPEDCSVRLASSFSFRSLLDSCKHFLLAKQNRRGSCQPMIKLVLFEKLWIGKSQLREFGKGNIQEKLKHVKNALRNSQTIFRNFGSNLN